VLCTLSPSDEHHVSLTDIRVSILQEEDFVDAIVLQSRELDEQANWSSQGRLNHQVLLPPNLLKDMLAGAYIAHVSEAVVLTYTFE
jgi:hypothetical protein